MTGPEQSGSEIKFAKAADEGLGKYADGFLLLV
jgi:hypothetical protein